MAATPKQWIAAIQDAMSSLNEALVVAHALDRNKAGLAGLVDDERYQSEPSQEQKVGAESVMKDYVRDAFEKIQAVRQL